MLRKPDPHKKKLLPFSAASGGDSRFLHELESLSKALALDPKPRRLSLPPDPNLETDPKPNKLWSWKKPLRALSHLRHPHRRFDCTFTLAVHSVESLPQALAASTLIVHWRRVSDSSGARTRPAKAFHGSAEFEETLACRCSVYGSSGRGPHGAAKYEPRQFLIYVTLAGATGFDFGKHTVELTRILPMTMEELEGERSSGEWSTSFRLAGRARGAVLYVSFGYSIAAECDGERKEGLQRLGSVRGVSFSGEERARVAARPVLRDVDKQEMEVVGLRNANEVFDELGESPEVKCCMNEENEGEEPEFTVIEQGVEIESKGRIGDVGLENVEVKRVNEGDGVVEQEELGGENMELANRNLPLFELEGLESQRIDFEQSKDLGLANNHLPIVDFEGLESPTIEFEQIGAEDLELANSKLPMLELEGLGSPRIEFDQIMSNDLELANYKLPMLDLEELESPIIEFEHTRKKDLVLANNNLPIVELEGLESPRVDFEMIRSNYKARGMKSKSLSLDDAAMESVASEFLSMLALENRSDNDPESPRELLWEQFKKESLIADDSIFGPDTIFCDLPEDFNLSSKVHAAEMEQENECLVMNDKSRAKMLEDAETEALMREWGLNEKVFEISQPGSSSAFGSPIHLPPEEPLESPPLGESLGPFIQTKHGGFLRSMSPSLFKGSKNSGSLVMQASGPVVVPAEMGSDIMEILQGLASVGIEKLSKQASKLMPLEDITSKTMQQVEWDAAESLDSCERLEHLNLKVETVAGWNASGRTRKDKGLKLESSRNGDAGSEYVSLEDLAPLAMDKIEALSIEGLRIQSGMSDDEAPSNISPQFIGEISALERKGPKNSISLGLEGAAGMQLLDVKDSGGDVDGLMGLSITLDEWMRLDSGVVDEEDEISERTTQVLAAHHAKSTELLRANKRGVKSSGRRCGLFGNNFTVALMVQLRDPLRNYEPVGTPMLALIQVERVFVPPKPKIYSAVFERGNSEREDELDTKGEPVKKEENKAEEDVIPQFKITEVHVAGLKTEASKKKLWGNPAQQQSGSRWLLASGMGKSNKHPFMKSNAVRKSSQATTKVQPGDTLWSISSRVHGTGSKWKELAALNPHIRNPNVIFPNETIRLR